MEKTFELRSMNVKFHGQGNNSLPLTGFEPMSLEILSLLVKHIDISATVPFNVGFIVLLVIFIRNLHLSTAVFLQDGSTVYLIYSIQGSGHFQGYAVMSSCVGAERSSDYNGQGGVFSVDWVKR